MCKELWKNIEGYTDYQISTKGNVRSFKTGIPIILKKGDCKGYDQVILYKNNNHKKYTIHRLVAHHFIPIPKDLIKLGYTEATLQINHKDHNPRNNRVENLEWCTCQQNVEYSKAKPITQFDLNGNFIKNWRSLSEAMRHNPNSITDISKNILNDRGISHNYIWKCTKPEYIQGYKLSDEELEAQFHYKQHRKISQFDLFGNFIKSYRSIAEAKKSTKINTSTIYHVLTKDVYSTGNYIWRYWRPEYKTGYKLTDIIPISDLKSHRHIPICQFDLDGNYIKTWKSIKDIQNELNITESRISGACIGKALITGGFYWRYLNEKYQPGYNLFDIDLNEAEIKQIQKIDMKTNNVVSIHTNVFDAYRSLSYIKSGVNGWRLIWNCCQKLIPSVYGYKWKFVDE